MRYKTNLDAVKHVAIKQYLGHLVTIITIIGGIVLDVIGLHIFSLVK